MSNYQTKADLKAASCVDTSVSAKKTNLAWLKADVDKLDIDKLESVLNDNLRSKVHKIDIAKLEKVQFDF